MVMTIDNTGCGVCKGGIQNYRGFWLRINVPSDAASGWARWALAHPEFGSSVNPIPIRGQTMPTTLLLAHPDLKIKFCELV